MANSERTKLYYDTLVSCLSVGGQGKRVQSIFDLVFKEGKNAPSETMNTIFPLEDIMPKSDMQPVDDVLAAENLLGKLAIVGTDVQAPRQPFADVTLYDTAKMAAAKAVCKRDYADSGESETSPYLLVGGDVSGIQSYIYQVASRNAAKALKGRSFYIRLLSDAVVRTLRTRLHLFRANIVYNSGGTFYLLAPNTPFVRTELSAACDDLDRKLYAAHGNLLYVAVDAVEISEASINHEEGSEDLPTIWKNLFARRDAKKRCRFSSVIGKDYETFFSLVPYGKTIKADMELTKQQICLGRALYDTVAILITRSTIGLPEDAVTVEPLELGFHYTMLTRKQVMNLNGVEKGATLVHLNSKSLEKGDCSLIHEYDFYGGNTNVQKTFDELCTDGSLCRLGVLRMDVDNLGYIFQLGLKPEDAMLERYSCLSRSFDRYFSGHLNDICQEVAPQSAIIIYSGGDDVFIVGSWEKTIELAKRIRSDFKTFTGGNPAFSISGGIAIIGDKYPVMRGAMESDEEEKKAKRHELMKGSEVVVKNSLSFMGTPLNWTEELPAVEAIKNAMVSFVEAGVPRSFLGKIIRHACMADIRNHKVTNYKSYWMLTYDISRQKKTFKDSAAKAMADCLIRECCGKTDTLNGLPVCTSYHALELWAFAARWAELYIRTTN